MKTFFVPSRVLILVWLICGANAIAASQPSIQSIRLQGTNLLVSATVPAGILKVTLESRSRFGNGTWVPRAVRRLTQNESEITFTLPRSPTMEVLRIRADASEPLPGQFYTGTNSFFGPTSTSSNAVIYSVTGDDRGGVGSNPGAGGAGEPATREVVESDIWKIAGNRLYFFNQNRGLQVIDITNPDSARILGQLHLPFAGEDLYLLDNDHIALLARDDCSWGVFGPGSKLLIVEVSSGIPIVKQTVEFSGYTMESRLVGSALYVASQTYRRRPPSVEGGIESWEAGVEVRSFDLARPLEPQARSALWFSGYGHVISATDRFLFVASRDPLSYYASDIRIIDISDPAGTMKLLSTIRTSGYVADKFKMHLNGNIFTTITAGWDDVRRWTTTLQTFSLLKPAAPVQLGTLRLAEGEQLHATRFSGSLAYIVTYFRIDPLWVVDLADPAHPRVAGELRVPGWSNFIYPWGDRLVTIGIDDTNGFRASVSLFSVSNPDNPTLLSRVSMGEGYSWSEANHDEQAFNVSPDDGLVLVPYVGYWSNGYAARVQLIDLTRDELRRRGVINHTLQPRRATLQGDRILSISATELLSVDASNRDEPRVAGRLTLAWPVDQVLMAGNYLLQITRGSGWQMDSSPSLRVTSKTDRDSVLFELQLPDAMPISGVALRDEKLYVAQTEPSAWWWWDTPPPPQKTNFLVTVLDTTTLPTLNILGTARAAVSNLSWQSEWNLDFPNPRTLLLSGAGGWGPWLDTRPGGIVGGGIGPIMRSGSNGRLIAFDVSDARSPRFASDLNVTSNSWDVTPVLVADNLAFLSHMSVEEFITTQPGTNAPVRRWSQRWYLDVVDYSDPADPAIRPPVNIPGRLSGLASSGNILFTTGFHWVDKTNYVWDGTEYLDASAYDGVSAHLVDSLLLGTQWPRPLAMDRGRIFFGRTGSEGTNGTLEVWQLSPVGKFEQRTSVKVTPPISMLQPLGDLLAAQTYSTMLLFDARNPLQLAPLADENMGCMWVSLDRADGNIADGLFVPLGFGGVRHFQIPAKP